MVNDAPGSEDHGILFVRLLGRWDIGNGMHMRLAIGEAEALLVEARRAWMVLRRAGPEDAVLLGNLLISDAPVVGLRSLCAEPQLVEDLACGGEAEVLFLAQALCQFASNLPVALRLAGRFNCLVVLDDAPLQVGRSALVLRPHRAR